MNDCQVRRSPLTLLPLAMLVAGSVDSIRNLPAMAIFGTHLIFFFLLALVFFILPVALIVAELSSSDQWGVGIYGWVKHAFGLHAAVLAIWFQWIENVFWYPTILSFIVGSLGCLICPSIATNKFFLVSVILFCFWSMTVINLYGLRFSTAFTSVCTMIGLLLPMFFIIILGCIWLLLGKTIQLHFQVDDIIPLFYPTDWTSLTGVILSFCGLEIASVYRNEVSAPQHTYPQAMVLAVFIIFLTLLCGSLSLALILPSLKISLVAGVTQAFSAFFNAYHLNWFLPYMILMLVIGGLGSVNNWMIAPTRGLQCALQDMGVTQRIVRNNRFGAPVVLLYVQACLVSVIVFVFLFVPYVNLAYWLLTVLASQLYMLMYGLMFLSAIRLRYKYSRVQGKYFYIPGKKYGGLWLIVALGFLGSMVTFCIGFFPPVDMDFGCSLYHYDGILALGLLLFSLLPWLLLFFFQKKKRFLTSSYTTPPSL